MSPSMLQGEVWQYGIGRNEVDFLTTGLGSKQNLLIFLLRAVASLYCLERPNAQYLSSFYETKHIDCHFGSLPVDPIFNQCVFSTCLPRLGLLKQKGFREELTQKAGGCVVIIPELCLACPPHVSRVPAGTGMVPAHRKCSINVSFCFTEETSIVFSS